MVEDMSSFRTSEETSNDFVKAYRLTERGIEIPDEPENGDWANKMLRYAELHEKHLAQKRDGQRTSDAEITEKREIHKDLDKYLMQRLTEYRKSVLKKSVGLRKKPHAQGKDSHVFYYGPIEDFLAEPKTPRYVTKYSVPDRDVGPDNIEYLRRKYTVLKKFLGDHIPRAWIIFGEFRHGIPKHRLGSFHTSLRAITLQREIRGKTFAEMTDEERQRPKVQDALREALTRYEATNRIFREACLATDVDPQKFPLDLDIGAASAGNRDEPFDAPTYSSPNVMYDEEKERVFFIDLGWGSWSPDKQKVFDYLMDLPSEGQDA